MTPVDFREHNTRFGPPEGLEESQCQSIPAYVHTVQGGSCDGVQQVVVAWRPTPEELVVLEQGGPIYVAVLGGLPPHYLCVDFHEATHPA